VQGEKGEQGSIGSTEMGPQVRLSSSLFALKLLNLSVGRIWGQCPKNFVVPRKLCFKHIVKIISCPPKSQNLATGLLSTKFLVSCLMQRKRISV